MPKGFWFTVGMIVTAAILFGVAAIPAGENSLTAMAGGAFIGLVIGLAEMNYRRTH